MVTGSGSSHVDRLGGGRGVTEGIILSIRVVTLYELWNPVPLASSIPAEQVLSSDCLK